MNRTQQPDVLHGYPIARRRLSVLQPAVARHGLSHDRSLVVIALMIAWVLGSGLAGETGRARAEEGPVDFESQIAPLLIMRCVECHGPVNPSGSLDLSSHEGLRGGGDSGDAIDGDDPEASYLLQRVIDGEMPPESRGQSQKLGDDEIELLRRWIASGSSWPDGRSLSLFERTTTVRAGLDWWSLQPVVRPEIPTLRQAPQPTHPIDAFVGARLESSEMSPAPRASKRVLVRRLYYDLIGLPPSEQQIREFENDASPTAWQDLVDRLLEKPQYGERWARFWLDLVRYSDTSGYERDQEKPFAWKYRDWVVTAFNQDMPYSQFIMEQLAGDEVDWKDESSVVATGFLRLGTWNDEPNDPLDYQYDRLEDLVHTTASAFLGLTVKCARCHTHKFDPIAQDDYYRMASVFWSGPIAARDRELLGGPSTDELGFREVLGWTDINVHPEPLDVLKNGERDHPLHAIAPSTPSFVPALCRDFELPAEDAKTTGRRLQLARWIANPDNPLTSRVIVNRVWQHHFGKALVRTPNNFGFLADPPTHPELLDWLASEFLASGGSLKTLHRLVLTSSTWQQSSLHAEAGAYQQQDPANRLWWHAERRRLDAEALRDSILAASGELDLRMGGESFKATVSAEALEGLSQKSSAWKASPVADQNRRSLYMYLKRGLLPPFMTAFDLCDATQSVGQRDVTTVPTQALALLNNAFVHRQSEILATKIASESNDAHDRVRRIWMTILKRPPSDVEVHDALEHVTRQRERLQLDEAVAAADESGATPVVAVALAPSLRLHLRADQLEVDSTTGLVRAVRDLSGNGHDAIQRRADARPRVEPSRWNGEPILHFSGAGQYLDIEGIPLDDAECTVLCVVNDEGTTGHREVISNWNSPGNVTTSMFLGLTAENQVRFTDAFSNAGELLDRHQPFILTAVHGEGQCEVFQSGRLIGQRGSTLDNRNVNAPWVVGQQGNIDGEFWQGGIAEIRVYDRAISNTERQAVEREIAGRYGLTLSDPGDDVLPRPSAEVLALASLCHVLLNCNEFVYVD